MFTIKIKPALEEHCLQQVNTFNFGHRYTANGNKEQQLNGIIGQSAVMELFNLGYVDGKNGFDGGVDIVFHNKKIDVKTMGRTTDVRLNYTNNFLKLQDYFETDIYIFCSFNKIKKEVTICGWITKELLILKRKYFPKGSIRYRQDGTSFTTFADLYEIDIVDLCNTYSISDLMQQIKNQ